MVVCMPMTIRCSPYFKVVRLLEWVQCDVIVPRLFTPRWQRRGRRATLSPHAVGTVFPRNWKKKRTHSTNWCVPINGTNQRMNEWIKDCVFCTNNYQCPGYWVLDRSMWHWWQWCPLMSHVQKCTCVRTFVLLPSLSMLLFSPVRASVHLPVFHIACCKLYIAKVLLPVDFSTFLSGYPSVCHNGWLTF